MKLTMFTTSMIALITITAQGNGESLQRTITIPVDKIGTAARTAGGTAYSVVTLPGADRYTTEPGRPSLPVMVVRFALPYNAVLSGFQATTGNEKVIGIEHPLFPAQQRVPLNMSPARAFTAPLDSIYQQRALYPANAARIITISALSEYRIIEFEVFPIRYSPALHQLTVCRQLILTLDYRTDGSIIAPVIRRSPVSQQALIDRVNGLVCNATDLPAFSKTAGVSVIGANGVKNGTTLEPADSARCVDYMIITSARLGTCFARLAQWRARCGMATTVKTVEAIDSEYAGVDLAAKIRCFIQDSWSRNGTLYFLIGGAPSVVPVRYVPWTCWPGYIPDLRIPTDLYYSDIVDSCYGQDPLRYDYDANHNGIYGELGENGDLIDQQPDVFLGRAPVETSAEAEVFVDKVLRYEQDPPLGFGSSFLSMFSGDFAPLSEEFNTLVLGPYASWIDPQEMYNPVSIPGVWSGDELLNAPTALNRLTEGYNLVYHFDHGSPYSLGTAVSSGGGWIYRSDVHSLTNASRPSIFITPACSPNAFDSRSISLSLLNNANGGAVAFIGNARVGFVDQCWACEAFFRSLYRDRSEHLGDAFNNLIAIGDNYTRFSMNLMGDPAMPVWTNEARQLSVKYNIDREINTNRITVSVACGSIGDTALVCLHKENDVQATALVALPGTCVFNIDPSTTGYVQITGTGRNLRPFQDSCRVEPAQPRLARITSMFCFDGGSGAHFTGRGNHDLVANPGETVALYPDIMIDSAASFHHLTIMLTSPSNQLQIISGQIDINDPLPGHVVHFDTLGGEAFLVKLSPRLGSGQQPLLVTFQTESPRQGQRAWQQQLLLDVRADSLAYQSHRLSVRQIPVRPIQQSLESAPDGRVFVTIDSIAVANLGDGSASGVTLRLVPAHPGITAADSVIRLGSIAPHSTIVSSSHFSLTLPPNMSSDSLLAQLAISNDNGDALVQPIKIGHQASSLLTIHADLCAAGIRVSWSAEPSTGYRAYRVYRAGADNFGWRELTQHPIEDASEFVDTTALGNRSYLYAVSAIDSFANQHGMCCDLDSVRSQAAAKQGFPVALGIGGRGNRMWGSPAIGDLDGDGRSEIVMGCDDGNVYAIDSRGQALPGWPVNTGYQIDNSTPALADINGDGLPEVVMGTGAWYTAAGDAKVHVFSRTGSEVTGWPQFVAGDAFASCGVADLNADGALEIVTATTAGYVYAWDGNGQILPGWPQIVGGSVYASPAIGDLDGDGYPEIVVLSNTSGTLQLNALHRDGTPVVGWPRIIPGAAGYALASPVLADLDGNGLLEIVQPGGAESPWGDVKVHCLHLDGTEPEGWPVYVNKYSSILASPAIGDLNNDGKPDVVICTSYGQVYAFSNRGTNQLLWQTVNPSNGRTNPVIADVDGDGHRDVVLTTEQGYLYSLNGTNGAITPGFPLWIESSWSAPAIADIDGDGTLDLVATGWGSHKLFAWDLGIAAQSSSQWLTYHGDNARTGCYELLATKKDITTKRVTVNSVYPAFSNKLIQNYPNPVSRQTTISYQLVTTDRVSLIVYNALGEAVKTLSQGIQTAGDHAVTWRRDNDQGRKVAAGMYLYRLRTTAFSDVKKIVVVQ